MIIDCMLFDYLTALLEYLDLEGARLCSLFNPSTVPINIVAQLMY